MDTSETGMGVRTANSPLTPMVNKVDALKAIKAANPKWSDRLANYALTIMPTSNEAYYERGSPERAKARAHWMHMWARWAIEMNILPDNAPIPPDPGLPTNINSKRKVK